MFATAGYFHSIEKTFWCFLDHRKTMVKAVAVLSSSEGVKGTIYFTEEGDGKTNLLCQIVSRTSSLDSMVLGVLSH